MKKYFAELVGTFFLVFFGLGLIAAAYGIGPISGCHINPAVSIGVWVAGRMKTIDLIGYWVGQFVGATLAAWVVYLIASGVAGGYNVALSGLGQNGFGPGYQGEYNVATAILYELVATLLFVIVVLGSTQDTAPASFAGVVIGLALVATHLIGIHITGNSVNPARSFGPAVFVGGKAIAQLWVFLLAPTLGGAAAGALFRFKVLAAD